MSKWFLLVAAVLSVLLWPVSRALAQREPPRISASIDASEVEVGEPFSISLNVTVQSGSPEPTDPRLVLPPGMTPSAPSISSQTEISFVNGRLSRRSGITATWRIVAAREGTFTIDGPSIAYSGERLRSNALRVTVSPAGAAVRSRRGGGVGAPQIQNPFDPFGMFPRLPNAFDSPLPVEPILPETSNPDLLLDAPLDQTVFLRAIAAPKEAVVGEQVTLGVYLYDRGGALDVTEPREPSAPDFFRRDLISPTSQPDPERVTIAGTVWRVRLLFQTALFALRAGDLELGPARATIAPAGRARAGRGAMVRESLPIKVHAIEPPSRGRPTGYEVGDVGAFALSAVVEPRSTEVGAAVAVNITLSGTGNVPRAVRIPLKASLEWLEPQTREALDADKGKIRGSRTFSYVVRPKSAGDIDLGEVTLPFWNPEKKSYETARARLGKIKVAPNTAAAAGAEPTVLHDPWSSIGAVRASLGTFPRPRPNLTDRAGFWLLLFTAPLAVVSGSLLGRGARLARGRLLARRQSPARAVEQALGQARAALARNDTATVASALDRALHLAIQAATGIRARGLLLQDVPAALEAAGLARDLSNEVRDVLSDIEVSRFRPESSESVVDLVARAAKTATALGQRAAKRDMRPEGKA
jgi:hypothetical protein